MLRRVCRATMADEFVRSEVILMSLLGSFDVWDIPDFHRYGGTASCLWMECPLGYVQLPHPEPPTCHGRNLADESFKTVTDRSSAQIEGTRT